MSAKSKVSAGRDMYRRLRPVPPAEQEFDGADVAASKAAQGAAQFAAQKGSQSARDALAFNPNDPLQVPPPEPPDPPDPAA